MREVRDDARRPDPGFAELFGSLAEARDLEPWLGWCRAAGKAPVLYLGAGAGRLALPLLRAGVELVAVDAHPGMLQRLRSALPAGAAAELVPGRIEELELGRRFELVMAPSGVLCTRARLRVAARHTRRRLALELVNPHWLAAGAGAGVRVPAMTRARARLVVAYPGGWTQVAALPLVWPEQVEERLDDAGLRLELMRGSDAGSGLEASPTFLVSARPRPGRARA